MIADLTKNQTKISDKQEAINWAKELLTKPTLRFLDTETTGLGNAFLCDISILSRYGSTMLDTLVKPPIPIPEDATRIHGITNEMVADAPEFPDVYYRIRELIETNPVCIYNAKFDEAILRHCCRYYDLPFLEFQPQCAMEWYAQFYGDFSHYWGNYKWQKLPNSTHRADGDARACFDLVKMMANSIDDLDEPLPILQPPFPPVQLACRWQPFLKIGYMRRDEEDEYNSWRRFRQLFCFSRPEFYWIGHQFLTKLDDLPF